MNNWIRDIHPDFSLEDYNRLLEQQGGVCAICKQPETHIDSRTQKAISLAIDHCHETGKIRGLLCRRCNQLLGRLEQNMNLILEMLAYKDRHKPI